MITLNKNCTCCLGFFVSGKEYGNYWSLVGVKQPGDVFRGLCEFCNPNKDNKWYTPEMGCHNKKI